MAVPKKKSIQAYPKATTHAKYMHICEKLELKASVEIVEFIEGQVRKHSKHLEDFKAS